MALRRRKKALVWESQGFGAWMSHVGARQTFLIYMLTAPTVPGKPTNVAANDNAPRFRATYQGKKQTVTLGNYTTPEQAAVRCELFWRSGRHRQYDK